MPGHACHPHATRSPTRASGRRLSASGRAFLGMALAAGPVVGGVLVDRFGWQSVFYLNVPIGRRRVRGLRARRCASLKHPEGRRLDLPGQALAIVGSRLADLRAHRGQHLRLDLSLILGLFAAAVVVGCSLSSLSSVEAAARCCDLTFFRNRTFPPRRAVPASVSFGMFGDVLLPQSVLSERAGLFGVPDGPALAADDRCDHLHGADRRQFGRPIGPLHPP